MPITFQDAVFQCLDSEWGRHVAHKHRGGRSGQKGVRYEDFFAAFKLAELLVQHMDQPSADSPCIQQQADEAFVDDLLVTRHPVQGHEYYQCKNAARLSWGAGIGSLAGDFKAQAAVSACMGLSDFTTFLVVPTRNLCETLTRTMPEEIASHSHVLEFPYAGGSPNRLVLEHASVREVLATLARTDTPTDDELANILLVLTMALAKMAGSGEMTALLEHAHAVSPGMIRLMPCQVSGFQLDPQFCVVLDQIQGLEYGISRGFFHWKAFGSSGIYPADCLSQEFGRFVQRVIQARPGQFEAFEEQL